ncbi:DUF2345 domain-containing protein, partial [Chromobacterium violaceum]|uniref:DUF2345 domain-containing protein n=1 Tax=Chromobacterium violaceum TaxID=536 RepID=UPI001CE23100
KDVTITSAKGKVQIAASQEVLLTSGGGYIRIAGGNIEIHCPSEVSVKGASHSLSGPASLSTPTPAFAKPGTGNLQVIHEFANGVSMNQGKFVVTDALGVKHKGVLDEAGKAMVHGLPVGPAAVQFLGRPSKGKSDEFPFIAEPEAELQKMGTAVKQQAMNQLSSLIPQPPASQLMQNFGKAEQTIDEVKGLASQAKNILQKARNIKIG